MPESPNLSQPSYNRHNDFLDNGAANVTPSGPMPVYTPSQTGSSAAAPATPANILDGIFGNLKNAAKADNPFMGSLPYTTPIKTELKHTLRYQDPEHGFDPLNEELEYQYGDRQGFLEQLHNNTLKFSANAVGAFVEGIATIPLAINAAQQGRFDSLYNNRLTNTIAEWTEGLETTLPNFQSHYEATHPVMSYINPAYFGNSWGGVLKNLGYTAGALTSAILTDVAIGAATGGAGVPALLGPQMLSIMGKVGKIFAAEKGALRVAESLAHAGNVKNAVDAAYKTSKITDRFRYGMSLLTSAVAEGSIEANQTFRNIETSLLEDFRARYGRDPMGEEVGEIHQLAKSGGNADLALNVALLTMTNALTFGSLLQPRAAAIRTIESRIAGGTKIGLKKGSRDTFEVVADGAKRFKLLRSTLAGPSRLLRANASEGFEEGAQYAFQRSAEDYALRKFRDKNISNVDNFMRSAGVGIRDTLTTREGLESIFMGIMSGAVIHGGKKLLEAKRGIDANKNRIIGSTLSMLNGERVTGLFENKYNEAVTADSIAEDMNKALESGDIFEYKNLKFQQLYNFVSSGMRANKFELRLGQLQSMKDLTQEEFEKMYGFSFSETNKKTVDAYVDAVIAKAEGIKKNIEKVNQVFKNPYSNKVAGKDYMNYIAFEEYKDLLALDLSEMEDNKRRLTELAAEMDALVPSMDKHRVIDLTHKVGLEQARDNFEARVKEIDASLELLSENKSSEAYKQAIKEKEWLQKTVPLINESIELGYHPDIYAEIGDILNYYANGNIPNGPNTINPIDLLPLLQKAQDSFRLINANHRSLYHYQALTSKQGFNDYIKGALESYNARYKKALNNNPLNNPEENVGETEGVVDLDKNGNPVEKKAGAQKVNVDQEDGVNDAEKADAAKEGKAKKGQNEKANKAAEKARKEYEAKADELEKKKKQKATQSAAPKAQKPGVDPKVAEELKTKEVELKQKQAELDALKAEPKANPVQEGLAELNKAHQDRIAELEKTVENLEHEVGYTRANAQQAILDNYVKDDEIAELEAEVERLRRESENAQRAAISGVTLSTLDATEEVDITEIEDNQSGEVAQRPEVGRYGQIDPMIMLNRVFSRDFEDAKERSALRDVLFSGPIAGIMNRLVLVINKATKGLKSNEYKRIQGTNLYRRGYEHDFDLVVDGNVIGKLQPHDSLFFKRGEDYVSIYDLKEEEYVAVTENRPETYRDFMRDLADYRRIVDPILTAYKGGKTQFSNQEVQELFSILPKYGAADYAYSANDATLIKDLKYRSKGDALVSLPMVLENGVWVRSSKPVIVNEKDLSKEDLDKLWDYLKTFTPMLRNVDSRYFYIFQLPDGRYTSISQAAARPAEADRAYVQKLMDQVRAFQANPSLEQSKRLNDALRNSVFISDSNGNKQKGFGNKLYLQVNKNGHVFLNLHNHKLGIDKGVLLPEFSEKESLEELVDYINQRVGEAARADRQVSRLGVKLDIKNFKAFVPLEVGSINDVADKLTVAVRPNVFKKESFSITIVEQGFDPASSTEDRPVGQPKTTFTPQDKRMVSVLKKHLPEVVDSVRVGLEEALNSPDTDVQKAAIEAVFAQVRDHFHTARKTFGDNIVEAVYPLVGGRVLTDRSSTKSALEQIFGLEADQAGAVATIYDQVAKTWAARTGKTKEDFYRGLAMQKGGVSTNADILYQLSLMHASPYEFDQFSTEHIGKGEGQQAFGWGLYFTNAADIAEHYAKKFAHQNERNGAGKSSILYKVTAHQGKTPDQYDYIRWDDRLTEAQVKKIEKIAPKGINLYENTWNTPGLYVDQVQVTREGIMADSPLSEATKEVMRKAIADFNEVKSDNSIDERKTLAPTREELNKWNRFDTVSDFMDFIGVVGSRIRTSSIDRRTLRHIYDPLTEQANKYSEVVEADQAKGRTSVFDLYTDREEIAISKWSVIGDELGHKQAPISGEEFYRRLARSLRSEKAASMLLASVGIDGIQYPAESLAGKGEDNAKKNRFNYVVFDGTTVTVDTKEKMLFQAVGQKGAANKVDNRLERALQTATQMEQAGEDARTITLATGWFRGVDGKWRYEINPNLTFKVPFSEVFSRLQKGFYTLGDIIDYPELFEMYPDMRKIPFFFRTGSKANASYTPPTERDEEAISVNRVMEENQLRGSLLHEIQHAVQNREGFEGGANVPLLKNRDRLNPKEALNEFLQNEGDELSDREHALVKSWLDQWTALDHTESFFDWAMKEFTAEYPGITDLMKEYGAMRKYRRAAGEVEAYTVAARRNLTEEERRATPFMDSLTVAPEHQILLDRYKQKKDQVFQNSGIVIDGKLYNMYNRIVSAVFGLYLGNNPNASREEVLAAMENRIGELQDELMDMDEGSDAANSIEDYLLDLEDTVDVLRTAKKVEFIYPKVEYNEYDESVNEADDIRHTLINDAFIAAAEQERLNEDEVLPDFTRDIIRHASRALRSGNPNMLNQMDDTQKQAAIRMFADGTSIIYALTNPNVSSPLHELAHHYEQVLTEEEKATVLNWSGDKEWTTETSESFARGFEKYLAEGNAPNAGLKQIFDNFRKWLLDIYKGIAGSDIDIELNDEMRAIYAQMLGAKKAAAVKQAVKTQQKAATAPVVKPKVDPTIAAAFGGVQRVPFRPDSDSRVAAILRRKVDALGKQGISLDEAIERGLLTEQDIIDAQTQVASLRATPAPKQEAPAVERTATPAPSAPIQTTFAFTVKDNYTSEDVAKVLDAFKDGSLSSVEAYKHLTEMYMTSDGAFTDAQFDEFTALGEAAAEADPVEVAPVEEVLTETPLNEEQPQQLGPEVAPQAAEEKPAAGNSQQPKSSKKKESERAAVQPEPAEEDVVFKITPADVEVKQNGNNVDLVYKGVVILTMWPNQYNGRTYWQDKETNQPYGEGDGIKYAVAAATQVYSDTVNNNPEMYEGGIHVSKVVKPQAAAKQAAAPKKVQAKNVKPQYDAKTGRYNLMNGTTLIGYITTEDGQWYDQDGYDLGTSKEKAIKAVVEEYNENGAPEQTIDEAVEEQISLMRGISTPSIAKPRITLEQYDEKMEAIENSLANAHTRLQSLRAEGKTNKAEAKQEEIDALLREAAKLHNEMFPEDKVSVDEVKSEDDVADLRDKASAAEDFSQEPELEVGQWVSFKHHKDPNKYGQNKYVIFNKYKAANGRWYYEIAGGISNDPKYKGKAIEVPAVTAQEITPYQEPELSDAQSEAIEQANALDRTDRGVMLPQSGRQTFVVGETAWFQGEEVEVVAVKNEYKTVTDVDEDADPTKKDKSKRQVLKRHQVTIKRKDGEPFVVKRTEDPDLTDKQKQEQERFKDKADKVVSETLEDTITVDEFSLEKNVSAEDTFKYAERFMGIKTLLENLKARFGLDYEVVDRPDEEWKGRFVDGKVLINLAHVEMDTPFHEYLHPWIEVLSADNPELYQKLADELVDLYRQGDPLAEEVLMAVKDHPAYSGLSAEDKMKEALVRYISRKAAENVSVNGERISEKRASAMKRLISKFRKWLENIWTSFGYKQGGKGLQRVSLKKFTDEEIKAEKAKDNNDRSKRYIVNMEDMTLQDVADVISLTDIAFDLTSRMDLIKRLDAFQTTTKKSTSVVGDEKKIIERIKSRLNVLSDTADRRLRSEELKAVAKDLRFALDNADEVASLNNFVREGLQALDWAADEFKRLSAELSEEDKKHTQEEVREMNKKLAVVKNIFAFYLKDVHRFYDRYADEMEIDAKHQAQHMRLLRRAERAADQIEERSYDLIAEWLYPAIEHTNELIKEKYPEYTLTKEQFRSQLKWANGDVDRLFFLLGSVSSSKDPVSAIVRDVLFDVMEEAHLGQAATGEIIKLTYDEFLKEKGLTNDRNLTSEYYKKHYLRKARVRERDGSTADGKPKYKYVERWAFHEEFFRDKWAEDYEAFIESLGDVPVRDTAEYDVYLKKIEAWIAKNGSGDKPAEKYRNPDFEVAKKDKMFNVLYDFYREANEKLLEEERLPFGMLPQVSRGMNMFSDKKYSENKVVKAGERALEFIMPRADESSFSQTDKNLDGSLHRAIKVAYVRPLDEQDLDFALPETVFKYAAAQGLTHLMREVEPNIITLKSLLNKDEFVAEGRKINQVTSSRRTIFDKIFKRPAEKVEPLVNRQLNAFIDDVVYGQTEVLDVLNVGFRKIYEGSPEMADAARKGKELQTSLTKAKAMDSEERPAHEILAETRWEKQPDGRWATYGAGRTIDMNKWGDNMAFLTALNNMAFNITAGVTNVTIGNIQTLGEAIGGRYYKPEDYVKAQRQYWGALPEFIADTMNLRKSKITQLGIRYDAIQGEFRDKYGKRFVGSVAQKYATLDTIFFLSHAAEHQIQLTGMLSLMNATKVKTTSGEEISLFDAYEQDQNGYYKLRPDAIWTKEQEADFTKRLHGLNKMLNGNYSQFDKAYLQRRWYGKLALVYRKFMYNGFRARWGGKYMDYEIKDVREGYYRTFIKKLTSDVQAYQWDAARRAFTKEGWNEDEKYAWNKTVYELSILLATTVIGMALAGAEAEEEKDQSWARRYLTLMMLRLRSDVGLYSVFGVTEIFRMMKNPSAVMQTLSRYGDFLMQLAQDPTQRYKRDTGAFEKGDLVLGAKFQKLLPAWRHVLNLMTPEEQAKFYNLTNKNFDK